MSHYVLVMGAATRDGKAGGRRHVGTGVVLYFTAYRTLQSVASCLEGTQCQYLPTLGAEASAPYSVVQYCTAECSQVAISPVVPSLHECAKVRSFQFRSEYETTFVIIIRYLPTLRQDSVSQRTLVWRMACICSTLY